MKALSAILILVSTYANAGCELFEDPPISTVNCEIEFAYLPSGSEWTRLFYNPSTKGLDNAGVLNATANVVMSSNDALVGKVEANLPVLDGSSVSASIDASVWIDVVLHRNTIGANTIELVAYRYGSGKLAVENSATTGIMGTTATTDFDIGYSYASNGTVTANIRASGSNQVLASLSVAQFGQTLPSLKLRRGTQPADSGVVSASFTQNPTP